MIERNRLIGVFFECIGFDQGEIRVIGSLHNPAVVYKDSMALSCYVKGHDLIFTSKQFGGRALARIDLVSAILPMNKRDLVRILEQSEHRPIYKVEHGDTGLYVCGYSTVTEKGVQKREPVFGTHGCKLYFSESSADAIVSAYQHYPLKSVCASVHYSLTV